MNIYPPVTMKALNETALGELILAPVDRRNHLAIVASGEAETGGVRDRQILVLNEPERIYGKDSLGIITRLTLTPRPSNISVLSFGTDWVLAPIFVTFADSKDSQGKLHEYQFGISARGTYLPFIGPARAFGLPKTHYIRLPDMRRYDVIDPDENLVWFPNFRIYTSEEAMANNQPLWG